MLRRPTLRSSEPPLAAAELNIGRHQYVACTCFQRLTKHIGFSWQIDDSPSGNFALRNVSEPESR